MGVVIDLTGQKFGRLKVIDFAGLEKNNQALWLCKCECGNTKNIRGRDLKTGKILSCGCWNREVVIKRNTTHGGTGTRLYSIWRNMERRCYYKPGPKYKYYGARGITVCKEWLDDFNVFKTWALSNGYDDSLTIDRKDNNGNYCPENCRWVSRTVQIINRRSKEEVRMSLEALNG